MTAANSGSLHCRPRLGLALGSGAALGAAHAGVIQALDEAGIQIDVVAGTSAGAIIGGGYAAGLTGDELVELVLAARWSTFARWTASRRLGLLDPMPMERSIEDRLGPLRIEDMARPFAALAFDLRTRSAVSLTAGPLAQALRASSAVPGLFPPVYIDGCWLLDGVLADSVPVTAARALGASHVIAVNPAPHSRVRQVRRRLPLRTADRPARNADVLLRPDTSGFQRWSPSDTPQLIAAGRRSVERAYDQLVALALGCAVNENALIEEPASSDY